MPKLHKSLVVVILFAGVVLLGSAGADSTKPKPEFVQRIFQGLGSVHHPVSTKSALAQRYFDQGLAFAYGFNHAVPVI
jgi:hypothetical protein